MISNNNPASERLLFLVSTLTGREESEPLVMGQKEWIGSGNGIHFKLKLNFWVILFHL